MRTIDADALKEQFTEGAYTVKGVREVIDNAPTIKPYCYFCGQAEHGREVERPKGEWLWLGDNPSPNHKWSCNKCGRGVKEQEKFCPNCGAKMKGDAE